MQFSLHSQGKMGHPQFQVNKFYLLSVCSMMRNTSSIYMQLAKCLWDYFPITISCDHTLSLPQSSWQWIIPFLEELAFERASQWLPTLGTCQNPHRSKSQLWRPEFLNWARASACTNLLSSSGDWDDQQILRSNKFKVIKQIIGILGINHILSQDLMFYTA